MSRQFELVEDYAGLGVHRTGTATQAATVDWLADRLTERGGRVERRAVPFERFVAEWSVEIDGTEVAALPLFYEAVGSARTADPARWPAFTAPASGPLGTSGALQGHDQAPGDVVVAATSSLLGLLAASNRTPELGSGVHVLQVAGVHGAALADGAPIRASIDARIQNATDHNVVAEFGDTAGRPVIITTPISGWFRCAGERGTGVAVALELAARLAPEVPVVFLGATGHELGGFGATPLHQEWAAGAEVVVHVGANVGCDWEGSDSLAAPDHSYMSARYAGPSQHLDAVASAFAPTGHAVDTPARERSHWFGEAAEWLDAPALLSLLGQNPWFHAPEDLPAVSCGAGRTEAITDAFGEAVLALAQG